VNREHKRIIGDTWLPLNAIISVNGSPLDLDDKTVMFVMENAGGNEIIEETETGINKQPPHVFTASARTGLITCIDHGAQEGDRFKVSSDGTLPDSLADDVRYYAMNVTQDNFAPALQPCDRAEVINDEGDGEHRFKIIGSVQFNFPDDAVDVEGEYRGWFIVIKDGKRETFPNDEEGILITVAERGATPA
jgi:hypothetical protein